MTLSSDLLPAMQHYALLAAALALLSLSLANVKRRPGVWVWYLVLLLPVAQIGWSLWETIREVNAAGGHAARWTIVQAVGHGVATLLVSVTLLYIATRSAHLPRQVRLEPTVAPPASKKSDEQRAT